MLNNHGRENVLTKIKAFRATIIYSLASLRKRFQRLIPIRMELSLTYKLVSRKHTKRLSAAKRAFFDSLTIILLSSFIPSRSREENMTRY